MNTAEDVSAFLSRKTMAVVGVSRNKDAFSAKAYADLKTKGCRVIPVNPTADRTGALIPVESVKAAGRGRRGFSRKLFSVLMIFFQNVALRSESFFWVTRA